VSNMGLQQGLADKGLHDLYSGSQTETNTGFAMASGDTWRCSHATPPAQSTLVRQSGKQYEYPEPVSGERQMFPGAQSSCWEGVPPSWMVHELLASLTPMPPQAAFPSPAMAVHFSLHQSQLPV
jgi:hypothetical protein